MKKYLALVLALVMLLALCACGDTAEEAAPAEETAAEEVAPAAEAEVPAAEAEVPAAEAEVPAAEAPAEEPAPAEEASEGDKKADGAPEGDKKAEGAPEGAGMEVEFFAPTAEYSKDFAGYKQYAIDGYLADQFHPADLEEETVADLEAMTEADYADHTYYNNLTDLGVLLTYEDFLAY